jgi:hypothetical protein
MENIKKYLPYILGGGIVLYLLFRNQGGGQSIGRAVPGQQQPDLRGAAFSSLADQAVRESDIQSRLEAERIRAANALALEQLRANTNLEALRIKAQQDAYNRQTQENAAAAARKQSAINAAIATLGKAVGGLGGGAGSSQPQARTPPIAGAKKPNVVRLPIVGEIDLSGLLGGPSPSQAEYPSMQLGNIFDLPGTSFDSGPTFYNQFPDLPIAPYIYSEYSDVQLLFDGPSGTQYGGGYSSDYGLPSYSEYYSPNTLGDYGYGSDFYSAPQGGGSDFGYYTSSSSSYDYGYSSGEGYDFGSTGFGYDDFGYSSGYGYGAGAYDFYGGYSGGGYVDSNIPTYQTPVYGGGYELGGGGFEYDYG